MNLKEMTSLALVLILIGTIFLPIQSTPLQAGILQNPSKIVKATQYWAFVVGIGEYAENPEQNRPLMILEANDFRNLLLLSLIIHDRGSRYHPQLADLRELCDQLFCQTVGEVFIFGVRADVRKGQYCDPMPIEFRL